MSFRVLARRISLALYVDTCAASGMRLVRAGLLGGAAAVACMS